MPSIFKMQKKFDFNFKILRFLLISPIFFALPITYFIGEAKAGIEIQWDKNSGYKQLKWYQKESVKNYRNQIYFFLRPNDRNSGLLKIDLAIPKTFKTKIKDKNISLCKVRIGGFDSRTKCLEKIPADIEIKTQESSSRLLSIYPIRPIPSSKDSYAIVLKAKNPNRSGLYQFHSYGQPAGKAFSSYLGSWTIVID